MVKRFIYILTFILVSQVYSIQTRAQQPSIYEVKRMTFNINGYSNISPVIIKDGIIFCSDRRYSGIKDRTSFDGRRLYNIYLAERKDSSEYKKPVVLKSERTNINLTMVLCALLRMGKTVYFTSEVETGKVAESRNFRNHSGIFIADLRGTELCVGTTI